MVIKTIRLKLYHPTAVKISVMEQAFERYRQGLNFLLEGAREAAERVDCNDKNAQWDFINAYLSDKERIRHLNDLYAQPFKDAMKRSFATMLMQWYQHDCKSVYPYARDGYLSFCRYSSNRDYCILYDTEKDCYYAKLHLLCSKDKPFPTPRYIAYQRFEMIGGELKLINPAPRYMLVPLSFGKAQMEVLQKAREGEYKLKAAALERKGKAYYLSVCVEIPVPKTKEVASYMGLARSTEGRLQGCVCDLRGEIIEQFPLELPNFQGKDRKEVYHIAANRIVEKAVEHQSAVVMENLTKYGDKLESDKMISARDYMAIVRLLIYKLPLKGLPSPVVVSPVRLYHTCPRCGCASEGNRMNRQFFLCTNCGYGMDVNQVGSQNLARRLIQYKESRIVFYQRKVGDLYEYSNRKFKIKVVLPGIEAFREYVEGLVQMEKYPNELASLIMKLSTAEFPMDRIKVVAK